MQNSNLGNTRQRQTYINKTFKRKIFFSKEFKNALLIAFLEAKTLQTYVNNELLLYGLISQPTGTAARLLYHTFSQYYNNKSLASSSIANRIRSVNKNQLTEKLLFNADTQVFSSTLWSENEKAPWLSSEVKDIIKSAIHSSLQNKRKVVIVNTKYLFFELLNKESIRDFLCQLVN